MARSVAIIAGSNQPVTTSSASRASSASCSDDGSVCTPASAPSSGVWTPLPDPAGLTVADSREQGARFH